MKKFLAVVLVCGAALGMSGCTDAQNTAARLAQDVSTVTNQGVKTINSLYTAGTINANDERIALSFAGQVVTYNTVYKSCIREVSGTKAASFLGCAQVFASQLQSPTFLASLHISNQNSQNEVMAIDSAALSIVNGVIVSLQNLNSEGK